MARGVKVFHGLSPTLTATESRTKCQGLLDEVPDTGRVSRITNDHTEPEHVHVERDDRVAKFWLAPVRLQRSGGIRPWELRRIARMIEENQAEFLEAWHDLFDD